MGFSSYLDAKDGSSIPAFPYADLPQEHSDVVMVLPDNTKITGVYDGYGRIGSIDILDTIAPYYFKKDACASDLFSSTKFIQYNNEHYIIDKSNYESPIDQPGTDIDGKTMNELQRAGAIVKSHFYRCLELVKIVKAKNYNGESYEELPASHNCPFQGYFYDTDEVDLTKDLRQ